MITFLLICAVLAYGWRGGQDKIAEYRRHLSGVRKEFEPNMFLSAQENEQRRRKYYNYKA